VRTPRSPSDIVPVINPLHASRGPFFTSWNPEPTIIRRIIPGPIMINNPSERFVRDPNPIVSVPSPMTVSKGLPIVNHSRRPDPTVRTYIFPLTILIYLIDIIFRVVRIIAISVILTNSPDIASRDKPNNKNEEQQSKNPCFHFLAFFSYINNNIFILK
jgi:hypothetical protein